MYYSDKNTKVFLNIQEKDYFFIKIVIICNFSSLVHASVRGIVSRLYRSSDYAYSTGNSIDSASTGVIRGLRIESAMTKFNSLHFPVPNLHRDEEAAGSRRKIRPIITCLAIRRL